MTRLTTSGQSVPPDFPVEPYEAVNRHVIRYIACPGRFDEYLFRQFAGAWNAISYRYLATVEYDARFNDTLGKRGRENRLNQEQAPFGFFTSGLSCIECGCFGAFMIASLIAPQAFSVRKPKDLRKIDPERLRARLDETWPSAGIAHVLRSLLASGEYQEWLRIRNELSHRGSPPSDRILVSDTEGGPPSGTNWSQWALKTVQSRTIVVRTEGRRAWLAASLKTFLEALQNLCQTHLPVPEARYD